MTPETIQLLLGIGIAALSWLHGHKLGKSLSSPTGPAVPGQPTVPLLTGTASKVSGLLQNALVKKELALLYQEIGQELGIVPDTSPAKQDGAAPAAK